MVFRYGDPGNPSRASPRMEDDYIQLQLPSKQGVHGSASGRGAIGPLPPSHPTPLSRLILRDLKLLITLSPEEEEQTTQPGQFRLSQHSGKHNHYSRPTINIVLVTFNTYRGSSVGSKFCHLEILHCCNVV